MIILRLDKNGGINKGDIKAFEHDNKSETYIIQLYKNNEVYDLTNKSVELTIVEKKRKYGDMVTLPIEAAAEGKVKLEIVTALTKQDGTYDFKLTVKDTAGLIETFPNFQVKIDTDITKNIAGEIVADKNFTILTEGLKALSEYEVYKTNAKKVPDIEKNVADLGSQLDNKANKSDVAKISSGTPLFASSISGMTDTTRNYVNTTDGYLYSYNGNSFVSSGVKYQEMGLSEGQVYSENTSFFIENLFDKLAVEEGGYYNNLNEKVNNANYVETDYIPVLKNQILMLTKNCSGINTQIIKFYDINKSFLNGQNSIGDNQVAGQIDQSKHTNCAYVRISLSKSSLEQYMITTGTTIPSSIIPYGINFKRENELTKQVRKNVIDIEINKNDIEINKNDIEQLKKNSSAVNVSKWKNKKWCVVGDSITEVNSTATIKYHDIIKEKIGCTVYNQGKSGTGYAVAYGGGLAIVDRVTDIPSDSDLITVFAGTNDWGRNLTTLGTFSDTTKSTFYGALKLSLEGIINKFPTKKIGVITPIPRNTYRNPNTAGETLEQYRNAILEVCEYFSIPCLDLYKESGFYVGNSTFNTTYLPDGLHPNNAGHELLAEKIEKWIETL